MLRISDHGKNVTIDDRRDNTRRVWVCRHVGILAPLLPIRAVDVAAPYCGEATYEPTLVLFEWYRVVGHKQVRVVEGGKGVLEHICAS